MQPEKKVSKQKAHGQREVRQTTGKKLKEPVLSSGPAPSTLALVQATSPHRSEVDQPNENEETRQTDIFIAHLNR